MDATRYADYRRAILAHLAAYRQRHFAARDALFEPGPGAPSSFRPESAHLNYFDPALYYALTRRPRAFRSLGNAQVLAISVFGTLARREDLALLCEVPCEDGRPVLPAEAQPVSLDLQQRVTGARRRGLVDIWLHGASYGLAVYGRFMERGLGKPLQGTLALAAALLAGGHLRRGTLLVVCDARNPAFAADRQASRQLALQQGLSPSLLLRRTTWQALAGAMARSPWYADLGEYLSAKYGIVADG